MKKIKNVDEDEIDDKLPLLLTVKMLVKLKITPLINKSYIYIQNIHL